MKTVKTLGFFLLLVAMSLCLNGCSEKDEYVSRIKELILKDLTFSSDGGTEYMTFRNEDLSNYSIKSSDESWCKPTIRKETCTIYVEVSKNETYDLREAVVTITDVKEPTLSRTFKVSQAAKDGLLYKKSDGTIVDLNEKDIFLQFQTIQTEGGQVSMEIQSNVSYTVKIDEDNADWISMSSAANTRGLDASTIIFTIAKNDSGNARTGYAYITNDKNGIKTTIIINQDFNAYLNVDPLQLSIDELGGNLKVTVKHNIIYDVYPQADWIQRGTLKQEDEETTIESFNISAFTEKKKSRVSTIIIENAAWDGMQKIVSVTQNRTLFITESEISMIIGDRKGTDDILYNVTDGELVWSSSNENIVSVTSDGTLVGVADGTATITVTSADGKHSDTVKVVVTEANEAKIDDSWSKTLTDGLVSSVTITLKNSDSREIYLATGSLWRVTTDVDEEGDEVTKEEKIGDDNFNDYLKAGESHQSAFSGIAPSEPSETAKYSYYMKWTYRVNNKEFTYTAKEK